MADEVSRVASVILGGGEGKRLFPLTKYRCKPAIPFLQCRLIDVPLSNSLHANIRKIFVITQFLSSSLLKHLSQTYRMDPYSSGFIEVLSPEQKPTHSAWYQGTADAVRQNLDHLSQIPVDYFLILSGDQLYHMNFQHMLNFAKKMDADLTIAALPISESHARRMGVLKVNSRCEVTAFHEKPATVKDLKRCESKSEPLRKKGISLQEDQKYLGSMGIYIFKREALFNLLSQNGGVDFGTHLIPDQIKKGKVAAFLYDGYWEDIGTIESFYQASLALTRSNPAFNCYNESYRIYSSHHHLPGSKITRARISDSIICDGSLIDAEEISHSVLGMRTVVKSGTIVKDSILFGNDFYQAPRREGGAVEPLLIDEECVIHKAIIDKNVRLGKGVKLINQNQHLNYENDQLYVRDGIIVVPQGVCLPDGYLF